MVGLLKMMNNKNKRKNNNKINKYKRIKYQMHNINHKKLNYKRKVVLNLNMQFYKN